MAKLEKVEIWDGDKKIGEITSFNTTIKDFKEDVWERSGSFKITYWIDKSKELFTKAMFYISRFRN